MILSERGVFRYWSTHDRIEDWLNDPRYMGVSGMDGPRAEKQKEKEPTRNAPER